MYQSITIIGWLGRDPEMRYMPNGDPVTSMNVATDRQYNDKSGQKVKETTWFRVSVFGKQAENVNQYLHKGSMVLVEGRLNVDVKTGGPKTFTRQDGTVGASYEIVASTVRFFPKTDGSGPGAGGGEATSAVGDTNSTDDPIPF